MIEKLDGGARRRALSGLPGWSQADGREALQKTFHFADFPQAFAFMTRVALQAEKMDHHPEWCNIYHTVEVTLTTHQVGGVSPRDVEMARFMDHIASPGA